jgi:hypothetical protein
MLSEVFAHGYQCPRGGRTFRLYPVGVSHEQASDRLNGLAVLFYVLGRKRWHVVAGASLPWVRI